MSDKETLVSIVKEMTESMTGEQSTRHWGDDALWFDIPPFGTPMLPYDGLRILVVTQRHKLGMPKPIGFRPLQEFHLSNSFGTQPSCRMSDYAEQCCERGSLLRAALIHSA